jgi:hypothetical protein
MVMGYVSLILPTPEGSHPLSSPRRLAARYAWAMEKIRQVTFMYMPRQWKDDVEKSPKAAMRALDSASVTQ